MKKIIGVFLFFFVSIVDILLMRPGKYASAPVINETVKQTDVAQGNNAPIHSPKVTVNRIVADREEDSVSVSSAFSIDRFRQKIAEATKNDAFIQTILDIEHSASYEDIEVLIGELYDKWVKKDPLAALDYSNVLVERFRDKQFRINALEKAGTHGVSDALEWLSRNNLGSRQEQDQNRLAVYSGLAAVDPIEALQRVHEIDDIYHKHLLELRALAVWSKHAPSDAITWLENESSITHELGLLDAYVVVVSPLIQLDPVQAEGLILGMASSEQKNILVSSYSKQLAEKNSEDAMRWAQNLTDLSAYSEAVSTTLEVVASDNGVPSKAIEYASKVTDPELREHFLTQALGYVAIHHPAVAARELSLLAFDEQKNIALTILYSIPALEKNKRTAWINAIENVAVKETLAGHMPN